MRIAAAAVGPPGPTGAAGRAADRLAGVARLGGRPRPGAGPPRRQARQHAAGAGRRSRPADRLRPGPRRGRREPDAHGGDRRHAAVHVAGAGARRADRRPERLVQPGQRDVRDVYRPRAVSRETSYGILRRITDTEPRPIREVQPGIPAWLAAIVVKLHAKDPAGRFASADELADLLEQCLAHVQQPTAVPLPDSVATLARLASKGSSSPDSTAAQDAQSRSAFPGRLGRVGKPILLFGSLAAGLIVLAWIAVTILRSPNGRVEVRVPVPGEGAISAEPSDSENDASRQSALFEWQDGVAEQIVDVREATSQFETRASRCWGDDASSASSYNPTNTIQPATQEVTK